MLKQIGPSFLRRIRVGEGSDMENLVTPSIATPMFMVFFVAVLVVACIALFVTRESIEHLIWRMVGISNKPIATVLSIGVAVSPLACLAYYFSAVY